MKLLNTNREELYSWTTDETGAKEIQQLQPGETYILQEVKARENYINEMIIGENQNNITKVENTEVTFEVNDVLDTQNIVLGNKAKVGDINITKQGEVLVGTEKDENGNTNFKYEKQNLAGAKYEIYAKEIIVHPDGHSGTIAEAGTKLAEATTTENGVLVTKIEDQLLATYPEAIQKLLERGLPIGKYEVKEVKAPEGYYRDEEKSTQEVEIKDSQEQEVITEEVTFENARQMIDTDDSEKDETTGEIKKTGIYQYDEETEEPIQGGVIGIYTSENIVENGKLILEKDTLVQSGITDENGTIKLINKLPLGKYYVKEIKAAKGYEYKDDKKELDYSKIDEDKEKINMYVEIKSRKTEVNILKTDIEGKAIKGAKLQLEDTKENVIESWDTIEEAYNVRGLETQKIYKITETQPAEGYVTEKEKYFSLDIYGNIVTDEENLYNKNTIMMKDEKTKTKIKVVEEKTGKNIIGVHVQIVNKETQDVICEFNTTEEEQIIEGLPIGRYNVIQTIEGKGYVTTKNEIEIKDQKDMQENILNQEVSKLFIKIRDTEEDKNVEASKIEIKDINTGEVIATTDIKEDDVKNETEGENTDSDDMQSAVLNIKKVEGGYLVEKLPIKEYELIVQALEGYKEIDKKNISIEDTSEIQAAEVNTRRKVLDMQVEKTLKEISINGQKQNVNSKDLNKIEIHRKAINTVNIEFEYVIIVTNVGEISGNIGKIVDEIPNGMMFNRDKSDANWYQGNNSILITEYSNKELGVGESKEYKVVLKWNNDNNNFGSKINVAKIEGVTNKLNYADKNENNNTSSVTTLLSVATGENAKIIIEIMNIMLFAIIIIGILVAIEIKILKIRNK